jgi:hypothetical protein
MMRSVILLMLWLAALPAMAADSPIFGSWTIAKAEPAPWVEPSLHPTLAREAKAYLGKQLVFVPGRVRGPQPLGCTHAVIEPSAFPPDMLFQGGLPEGKQADAARALGFPEGMVKGVELNCSTGLFSYHFRDDDTVLVALSDNIYTLTRRKGR